MTYDALFTLRSMLEMIAELLYDIRDAYPDAEELANDLWAVLANLETGDAGD